MANFIEKEKDKYKIDGILTEEDIQKINSFKNYTTLILDNTKGLSSELISKINTDRVVFCIKGGLDYENKSKYNEKKYIDRTFISLKALKKIIKYFEYNEKELNPNWNEVEKAMFLYNCLVVDFDYSKNFKELDFDVIRSLNGILYNKLTCSGFALVYKEMLDRVGIKCYYQNKKDIHSFNVIEIDGKKYGVDVTWDNGAKKDNEGKCVFREFGHDENFYEHTGHKQYIEDDFNCLEKEYDEDEKIYDLSMFDVEYLRKCLGSISNTIQNRKSFKYNLQDQTLETKYRYLPFDIVKLELQEEANKEQYITSILYFLKSNNKLQINPEIVEAYKTRNGYIQDMITEKIYNLNLTSYGLKDYEIHGSALIFWDGTTVKLYDDKKTIHQLSFLDKPKISDEELNVVCKSLNKYLNDYFKKYILDQIKKLDTMLNEYEYNREEFDEDRFSKHANIFTKLRLIRDCPTYLKELGFSENEIKYLIQKIENKENEIHKTNKKEITKKERDLDFLYAVFGDKELLWQTIEFDLKHSISEKEFLSRFKDVNYIIDIANKYLLVVNKKFNLSEYDVTKEDLQQILNTIVTQKFQKEENKDTNKTM